MADLPKISDSEWEVMKVVWAKAPVTATEIIERLKGRQTWKPKTVKTLIARLVQKKALSHTQKEGREYYYTPVHEEKEYVRAESRSFLQRIYGGSIKPMLVHYLENEPLTDEDIRELKQLLKEKER